MNKNFKGILNEVSYTKRELTLTPKQFASILRQSEEHLLLFDPGAAATLPEQEWRLEEVESLVKQILSQSRKRVLEFDIPLYQNLLEGWKNKEMVTSAEFTKSVEQVEAELNQVLLGLLKNRATPNCSVNELSTLVQYIQSAINTDDDVTIEEVDQWRYHQEYTKEVQSIRDFVNFVGTLHVKPWERELLREKVEQLEMLKIKEQDLSKTLPTQSEPSENYIDSYYHSQIQRLEDDIKENQQMKLKLQSKVSQLQENSEIINTEKSGLLSHNIDLIEENQQLKQLNKKLGDEMQIMEFSHARQMEEMRFKINDLIKMNKQAQQQNSQLQLVINSLESELVSKHPPLTSSGNLVESFGIKHSDSLAKVTTLGNQIRSLEQGSGAPSYHWLRKLSIGSNRLFTVESLREEEGAEVQRLVVRVAFVQKETIEEGYLNIGRQNLYLENKEGEAKIIIPLKDIRLLQVYGCWLLLQLKEIDYIIQTHEIKRIVDYIAGAISVAVRAINTLKNKAFRTEDKLLGVKSFSTYVHNPNKVIMNESRWLGEIQLLKWMPLRSRRQKYFGVLKDDCLLLFGDRSLMRVYKCVSLGPQMIVTQKGNEIGIVYEGFRECQYRFSIEDEDLRERFVEEIRQIKKLIRLNGQFYQREYRIG